MIYFRGAATPNLSGALGASTEYDDGDPARMVHTINRPSGQWEWQVDATSPRTQMLLDSDNSLSVFDPANPDNSIVLTPGGAEPGITINGQRVASLVDGVLTAGNFTANGDVALRGNSLAIGSFSGYDLPGLSMIYYDGAAGTTSMYAYRWASIWNWMHSSPLGDTVQMQLDQNNILHLFNADFGPGSTAVQLNPRGNSYFTGGNVGVGTPDPAEKLSVVGTIQSESATTLSGTTDGLRLNAGGSGYGVVAVHSIAWAQGNGSLILGRFGMQYNGGITVDFVWKNMYSGGASAAENMRLTGDGKLGIGTPSPSAKLDVNGDTKVGGDLRVTRALRL